MNARRDSRSDILKKIRRVVIKIGSTVVASRTSGVNQSRIRTLSEEFAWLRGRGIEVIVVTSGAVAAGMGRLGLAERPKTIELKQAAASVGQSALMRMYEKSLAKHGIGVGQMLLTSADLSDRRRYLNARNTLNKLIELGVIPIINENDTVSVEELKFSDNDNLGALVTDLANADALVILSDVEGLYDKDPANKDARLIHEVESITPEIEKMAGGSCSLVGTGGMASKLVAAKKAGARGAACFIMNGRKAGNVRALFDGETVGTMMKPGPESLSSKKHWIAFSMRGKGRILVDEGAAKAILAKGKSLLPSGIKAAEGRFDAGDAVEICREDGTPIARGLIHYGRDEVERIKGCKSADIEKLLGYKYCDEVIHRDDLVVM